LLLALPLLTAWGRVYSGLHFPFDILGSVVVAAISALLVLAFRPLRTPINHRLIGFYNALPLPIKGYRLR